MLAHLVGDLHQPLHVGAVYLDCKGQLVDPDVTHTIDPNTETAGANVIFDQGTNFHLEWDTIPSDLGEAATPELVAMARSEPGDRGRIENWSVAWATDTILAAQQAFSRLNLRGRRMIKAGRFLSQIVTDISDPPMH